MLAACSVGEGHYPAKGDVKPHPGVARATRPADPGHRHFQMAGHDRLAGREGAGTRFVYIKATEGGDHVDPKFLDNWNGAKAAGVARGAYHFVYWCRPAHEQVMWFTQHIPAWPMPAAGA
jgi:lysozyme